MLFQDKVEAFGFRASIQSLRAWGLGQDFGLGYQVLEGTIFV